MQLVMEMVFLSIRTDYGPFQTIQVLQLLPHNTSSGRKFPRGKLDTPSSPITIAVSTLGSIVPSSHYFHCICREPVSNPPPLRPRQSLSHRRIDAYPTLLPTFSSASSNTTLSHISAKPVNTLRDFLKTVQTYQQCFGSLKASQGRWFCLSHLTLMTRDGALSTMGNAIGFALPRGLLQQIPFTRPLRPVLYEAIPCSIAKKLHGTLVSDRVAGIMGR